jgi:aminoglycoside N3'-acetyltransferase
LPALWFEESRADYLISEEPWNYAFGLHSPLDRFLGLDGEILLLGSDHDTVTFLHFVEHVVEIPDKRIVRLQVPAALREVGRFRHVPSPKLLTGTVLVPLSRRQEKRAARPPNTTVL